MAIHLPAECNCYYLPNEATERAKRDQSRCGITYLYYYPNWENLNIEFLFGASKSRPCGLMIFMTKDIIHDSLIHSFINKYLLSDSSLPGTVLA